MYVEYAKPAVPIAVNKMIINNADDSDVGRIEALQYTRLVATDDDIVKEEKDYVYVFTNGATHGFTLRCYDVSSGTPTVLFEEILNGGYITWTNNLCR